MTVEIQAALSSGLSAARLGTCWPHRSQNRARSSPAMRSQSMGQGVGMVNWLRNTLASIGGLPSDGLAEEGDVA
jgi:hypothetical protein